MLPLLPFAVVALGGTAFFLAKKPAKANPARQMIFQKALNEERDPVRLRALADEFRKEGLTVESDILVKRAKLRELPSATKEARRAAFKKAMTSSDRAMVLKMAAIHESEGASGAAEKLRQYAKGLKQ